jgi:hypothetical protein
LGEVEGEGAVRRSAPEEVKCPVEERQVCPVVDEEGAGGVAEVGFVADWDVVEGVGEVEHAPRAGVQPQAAQQPPEEEEVVEEVTGV